MVQLATLFVYGWLVFDVPVPPNALELVAISLGLVFAVGGLGCAVRHDVPLAQAARGQSFAATADVDGIAGSIAILIGIGVVLNAAAAALYRRRYAA